MATLALLLLAACGNTIDDALAEEYIKKGEEVVSLLHEESYGKVHAMFDEQMKAGLSEAQMAELTPIIQEAGTFEKIDKSAVEEDDGYYVVVLVAKYSEQNRVYTITFNDEDKIAGLFIQ